MLYKPETWAMTKKDEDILRKCDRRMLRYMARVKWQDGVSSEEVVRRCGLRDILERAKQESAMVWMCEKRGRGGGIEESGENAGDRK